MAKDPHRQTDGAGYMEKVYIVLKRAKEWDRKRKIGNIVESLRVWQRANKNR